MLLCDSPRRAVSESSCRAPARRRLPSPALAAGVARPAAVGASLIHHSDQRSQLVSLAFGQQARDAGIAVSMGGCGDAYDNAVVESLFATLKKELIRRHSWPTRREPIGEVFIYIEAFYNLTRRHSTLGYFSPGQFELRASAGLAATPLASKRAAPLAARAVAGERSAACAHREPHGVPTDPR